jgi:hypothetical protein
MRPGSLPTATKRPLLPDADGVPHWLVDGEEGDFQWTGTDTFGSANIPSIALEVPNDLSALGR